MKSICLLLLISSGILTAFSAWSQGESINPYRVDVAKIHAHAKKYGFTSVSSEHNTAKYFGTKNLENIKIEQVYEVHYGGEFYLSVVCKTCLTKNIPPKEHAMCRAEFVKLLESVYGKRPDIKALPYDLTPAEGEMVKKFGADDRFQIKLSLYKGCEEGKEGYQWTLSDLSSIITEKEAKP